MIMNYGELLVEEVFTIKGRGIVAYGRVKEGTFRTGDDITILKQGGSKVKSTVKDLIIFGTLPYAAKGDIIGLLLDNVSIEDVSTGDLIKRIEISVEYE